MEFAVSTFMKQKNGSPELLSNVFLQVTIVLIVSKKPVLEKMHSDVKH